MKFTSEDLLKAMGLKVGDRINHINDKLIVVDVGKGVMFRGQSGACFFYKPIDYLIGYEYEIIQPKPILTEDEKVILRNLPKYIINIYRDRTQNLFVGSNDGSYTRIYYQHMFDFIKVGDGCYSIEELLRE